MILASRSLLIGIVGIAAVVALWLMRPPEGMAEVRLPTTTTTPTAGPVLAKGMAVGVAGCSATACHGGPASDVLGGKLGPDAWRSSASCWTAADPHSGAYSLLTDKPRRPVNATAAEIMTRLGGGSATTDARCLACHSNPALAEPGPTTDSRVLSLRNEGVSCEACHGNAGGWLRDHTTWKLEDRDAGYAATGMIPMRDIGDRALACAGCHVGSPAGGGRAVRDMNHDMIAAGHPRLNFDFAEFHRRLPKHWHEENKGEGFESRWWLIGRMAHAEAACRLLADRAERAKADDPRTPWPEFAEFNCASCHHTIPNAAKAGASLAAGRPAGSLKWQTIWPVDGAERLKPVLRVMEGKKPAGFDKVIRPATEVAKELVWLRERVGGEPTILVHGAVAQLFGRGFPDELPDRGEWDDATQVLFGLAALERDRPPDARLAEFDKTFDALRRRKWDETHAGVNRLLEQLRPWVP